MHGVAMRACSLRQPGLAAQQRLLSRSSVPLARRRSAVVRASKTEEEEKKRITDIELSLKRSGLDKERAQQVLKAWRSASGDDSKEITPEDLRKVLVKQGSKVSSLVVIQILLDIGAAYGAWVAGNFIGLAILDYGTPAVVLQAVAYFVAGYYAIGAVFDFFKLGMLIYTTVQFNVNSAAFLAAVQDLAGSTGPTGLATVDKAVDAVNTLKVVAGLNKMAELLKASSAVEAEKNDMLRDLAVYLTLEKAQRVYGFDQSKYGIDDRQAAQITTVFTAFDADDNGLLSLEEFQRLCREYAPELSPAEIKAGLEILDTNMDGSIQLGEFVAWWVEKVQPPSAATNGAQ